MKRIAGYVVTTTAVVIVAGVVTMLSVASYFFMKKKGPSAWQQSIEKTFAQKKSGRFQAQDKAGAPVILEWQKLSAHDQAYAQTMRTVEDIFIRAFAPVDTQYLQGNPEVIFAVEKNHPYRKLEPLFKDGAESVDWKEGEKILVAIAREHWHDAIEEANKKYANSIFFFVLAKDPTTQKLLGFIVYRIDDDDPRGAVEFEPVAVAPEEQKRGLGKLLVSSIFKIIPETTWIIMSVQLHNENAIKAYQAWGFAEMRGQKKDAQTRSIAMEYRTERSGVLQKVANGLAKL